MNRLKEMKEIALDVHDLSVKAQTEYGLTAQEMITYVTLTKKLSEFIGMMKENE